MLCFFRSRASRVDKVLWKACLKDIEFNKFITTVVMDSFDIKQNRTSIGKWEVPESLPVEIVLAEIKSQRREKNIKYTIDTEIVHGEKRYYLYMYDPIPYRVWKKEH